MQAAVASSKIERRKQGKALRVKLPRTAQADWKPRAKSQDIVKLLEESDVGRIRGLLPVKFYPALARQILKKLNQLP